MASVKPTKLLRCSAMALAAAFLGSNARADEFDWLYFPMYARDTAHAVHLSALQRRPDGLLASATRYPRVSDDPWSKAESDAGWYDYEERLIDCETGLALVTHEHLLDQDGKTVASRDNTSKNLARWKAELAQATQPRAWPEQSELFLACAAAADQGFLGLRRQARKTKVPTLSYSPRIQSLQAETHDRFWAKVHFRPDLGPLRKPLPATAERLFEGLLRQHRAWLTGFAPALAAPATGRNTDAVVLSEDHRRWLAAQGAQITQLSSRPDGVVRYTDRQPDLADIPPEYRQPPKQLREAAAADLEIYLDCASGLQVATRLTWRTAEGAPLRSVPISAKALLQHLTRQMAYADGNGIADLLSPAPNGGAGRAVCAAVAAQCTGKPAAQPEAFSFSPEEQARLQKAADPAAALLAARQAWRNHRRGFVPDCALGQPF